MHGDASDEDLLQNAARDPEGFGVFYARHERAVLGFFLRAAGRGELAIDFTAETFARAFESRASFDPERGSARAWLFGIARHVLSESLRRGRVDASARVRTGMVALAIDDRLLADVESEASTAGDELIGDWLGSLPREQRSAVRARVLEERSYREIAAELDCSEAVVRQRVSRGLSTLREGLEGRQ
jgi:RNA polymerase sigma-70 factor (ECF subfamily)